jgi:4-hydroxy-3-polyprenylbenzoate decarboxylase
MAYSGLAGFITCLENNSELHRIKIFVDPVLEITELTDRITKSGGKALLFENTGTSFPLLINAYGSDRRMALAIGRENLENIGEEIESLFNSFSDSGGTIFKKLAALPSLFRLAAIMPSRIRRRGSCQQVVLDYPDLGMLPVLKCWPHDGGRYITLPMVHTRHPDTGKTNVGMYRMQILDKNTTAMHWQRHKTGANHYDAWKKAGRKMPVSVALGGDPVYAYSATAPLPENLNEYILAGFLRKKKVKMVKCITNDLYVPSDADIIIEGYVDTSEDLVWEGPFGDHTGFYSLADWYPKFHVTCITHSKRAVYPATIVGVPPQEDAWLAKATERIFLSPVRLTLQPEIIDFHMPEAGIAHNLVVVKIRKNYPGQGLKIISSLFGAGQMMFTKYLLVVSGAIDIRNYLELLSHLFDNVDLKKDLLFIRGPLDVLDHSSENFSFGGKLGVDATVKLPEELAGGTDRSQVSVSSFLPFNKLFDKRIVKEYNYTLFQNDIPILILSVDMLENIDSVDKTKEYFRKNDRDGVFRLILIVDYPIDPSDYYTVAWQVLGNSDPQRDHEYLLNGSLLIDGTIKAFRKGGFSRKWPNVVCSDIKTIKTIDEKWDLLKAGPFLKSPSLQNMKLLRKGKDEILSNND